MRRPAPNTRVGIDLGLKALATMSDEREIAIPQFYRKSEAKLATMQRARKTPKRVRNLHAKIANRRKISCTRKARRSSRNTGSLSLATSARRNWPRPTWQRVYSMPAGRASSTCCRIRRLRAAACVFEVNEAYTSQVCSACGCMPEGRPKGIADLGMRGWACSDCGAIHSRDVNAAGNILRVGLDALIGGAHV